MRLPTEGNVENDVGQDLARSLQELTGELVPVIEAPRAENLRALPRRSPKSRGDEPTGAETVLIASAAAAAGFDYVKRE